MNHIIEAPYLVTNLILTSFTLPLSIYFHCHFLIKKSNSLYNAFLALHIICDYYLPNNVRFGLYLLVFTKKLETLCIQSSLPI